MKARLREWGFSLKMIEQWTEDHARWPELMALVQEADELRGMEANFDWHIAGYQFVALEGGKIVGFLRYVTQPIGPDNDCPALTLGNVVLIEGKVMVFYVLEVWRRMGFGRKLQQAALTHAKSLNLYQLRSRSSAEKTANHQLKLSMGFSAVPTFRKNGRWGIYFLMPLQSTGEPR